MATSNIKIPDSKSVVQVSIIDAKINMGEVPTSIFFGPDIEGFTTFSAPCIVFLITHTDASTGKQRRIVFDLGLPKDWEQDLPQPLVDQTRQLGSNLETSKYVSEILEENDVSLDSIESVVWSHTHLDHTGRVSLFPPHVTLITGPGVKDSVYPGWPTNPDSPVLEREVRGREFVELDFTASGLKLGGFDAIDYFGDGSFYFLSAPGHAIGHLNALARTTSGDRDHDHAPTFILMGADSYHHNSQLRPSAHVRLPAQIPNPLPRFADFAAGACPGEVFAAIHPSHAGRKADIPPHYADELAARNGDPAATPFVTISSTPDGQTIASDIHAAKDTIRGLQVFDGEENIFLVSAHDNSLRNVVEFFPKGANDWKAKGWKEEGRWRFLDEMHEAVEVANRRSK